MVATWSLRSFLVAFLAVLLQGSLVEAKGSAGRGRGRGIKRKDIENAVSAIQDLSQMPIETAIFSFYVFFAILTLVQLVYALGLFKKRSPQEELPRRFPFAILIILFAATLLTAYSLIAALWRSESSTYDAAVENIATIAMVDFLPRLADIFILGAVLLLLRYRRDILIADQYDKMTVQQIQLNSAMRYLPVFYFGIMFIASLVRLGLLVGVNNVTLAIIDTFDAMGHVYLACLIFVTFHVVVSAVLQWRQVKKTPSTDHVLFDENVLDRIVVLICPALVLRTLYVLITYIVIFVAGGNSSFNYAILGLIDILFLGTIYAFVIAVATGLGELPEQEEGDKAEKKEKDDGPAEAEV